MKSLSTNVTPERLRAWWWTRQGLDGSLAGAGAAGILERTGWMRTVGGASPYVALFARAGLSRTAVDDAVAHLDACELPAARGCTYLVPASDYALALRAGQAFGATVEIAAAKKHLGVTEAELETLSARVLDALTRATLDPAELKDAVGGAVRSLGDAGRKRGLTSTLPLVLGRLQSEGAIRRVPVDGRLDRQRYRYAAWSPGPLAGTSLSDDDVARGLAARYFRWAGPATVEQFAWWSGLGVKAARTAAAAHDLARLGPDDARLLFADDRDALLGMPLPQGARPAFLAILDNLFHLRREIGPLLDAADAARPAWTEREPVPIGSLADLEQNAIVDGGRVIGLWDYDGLAGDLVWAAFGATPAAVHDLAAAFARYVEAELGDVRTFSLDSPKSRTERIEWLRSVIA